MKKLLDTLFNHERYQTIAIILISALLIWTYGCPSQVESLFVPGKHVTRSGLQIEMDTLLATAAARVQDLDQQDAIKRILYQQALLTAAGSQVNILGLVTSIAAVLGIGATVDNVRKRKELKDIKNT